MGQYTDEYLKMMQSYENPIKIGNCIGTVIEGFPNIKISILNGDAVLYPEMLYFSEHILAGYTRQYTKQGNITFADNGCGETDKVNDGGDQASSHKHNIESLNIDTKYNATGTIKFTDSLVVGDKVMLCPSDKEDIWFVIDKIRKVV